MLTCKNRIYLVQSKFLIRKRLMLVFHIVLFFTFFDCIPKLEEISCVTVYNCLLGISVYFKIGNVYEI